MQDFCKLKSRSSFFHSDSCHSGCSDGKQKVQGPEEGWSLRNAETRGGGDKGVLNL